MFTIVVGPPLWWGLLCTCTLCTLGNPALTPQTLQSEAFYDAQKALESFSAGALSPRPPSRPGRGKPPAHSPSPQRLLRFGLGAEVGLGAFGASILALSALGLVP